MTIYQNAILRLQANDYKVSQGVEVTLNSTHPIYIEVEVSPFSVYSNVEKIKRILPDMDVRRENSNGGVGRITIKSRP